MNPHTVFFVGKPGSGKGDQAKLLSDITGWRIIAAGEQFRAMSAQNTPVGRKMKTVNDAGGLQPHWLAEHLFLESIFSVHEDEDVILDGFGRRVPEAELIVGSLRWLNRQFSVVHLRVSDEEVKKRLALRKDIEGRADDDAVDERLREYRENTEPAMEVFRSAGALVEVNGEGERETIAVEIRRALGLN